MPIRTRLTTSTSLLALAPSAFAILLIGCGGAALVVKPPIVDRCRAAALQGCDELADGAIAYIEGDKEQGTEKLVSAAAQNSPREVRTFAMALKQLGKLPGMGEQMGPLLEIAELIAPTKEQPARHAKARAAVQPEEAQPEELDGAQGDRDDASVRKAREPSKGPLAVASASTRSTATTADTDVAQLAAGVAIPASGAHIRCNHDITNEGFCTSAVEGPFVLTDLVASPECAHRLTAQVGDVIDENGAARWVLSGLELAPAGFHGMRLAVRGGEALRIGMEPKPKAKGDAMCAVTWAGFKPYPTSSN